MGWEKHQPSHAVHQQEHASLLIKCLYECSPARDGGEGLAGAGT